MDRCLLKSNAKQQLGGSIFHENWLLGLLTCFLYSTILSSVSGVGTMIAMGGNAINLIRSFTEESFSSEITIKMLPSLFTGTGVVSAACVVLAGPLAVGYAKVFLDLVYGDPHPNVNKLFDGFRTDFGGNIVLSIMVGIFTFLWMLLFIIPGIVKAYAYSMAFFVKAEHPEYDWRQCINTSKEMMRGYKFKLFVLELSFIGWWFVCLFTFGLGGFWLSPYIFCTKANFYAWRAASYAPAAPSAPAWPSEQPPAAPPQFN